MTSCPTTVTVTIPALLDLTETATTPFLPVFTSLLTPVPASRTVAPATGLPAVVSLMVTFAFLPTGIVFCVTRICVQTAAAFTGFGFGFGFGLTTGGVNGGVVAGGVVAPAASRRAASRRAASSEASAAGSPSAWPRRSW